MFLMLTFVMFSVFCFLIHFYNCGKKKFDKRVVRLQLITKGFDKDLNYNDISSISSKSILTL